MQRLKLTNMQKAQLVKEVQEYFEDELDIAVGQFDIEFLLEFFEQKLGNSYYNKGLNDAQTMMHSKLELLTESIVELEQPSDY